MWAVLAIYVVETWWPKKHAKWHAKCDMQSESWKLKVSHTKWTKKVESWHGRFILVLHGEPWFTQWVPKVDRRNAERSFIAAVISKCLVTGFSACLLLAVEPNPLVPSTGFAAGAFRSGVAGEPESAADAPRFFCGTLAEKYVSYVGRNFLRRSSSWKNFCQHVSNEALV